MHTVLELVSEWKIRKAKEMSEFESIPCGHAALLFPAKELTSRVSADSIRLPYQYSFEPGGTQTP